MKTFLKTIAIAITAVIFTGFAASAQTSTEKSTDMKTYVIEREIPGAGSFDAATLKGISQKSCGVLKEMDGIEWVHSYVTGNKIYCVYKAKNMELIKEHAKRGGFPANSISEVTNMISPATAE